MKNDDYGFDPFENLTDVEIESDTETNKTDDTTEIDLERELESLFANGDLDGNEESYETSTGDGNDTEPDYTEEDDTVVEDDVEEFLFDLTEIGEEETNNEEEVAVDTEVNPEDDTNEDASNPENDTNGETDKDDESVIATDEIFNSDGDIVIMDKGGEAFKFEYIDINKIMIPERIRKSPSIEALQTSIAATGLLKPIVVAQTATEGTYVLIDGLRRLAASAKCGITKIPCIINNKVKTTELSIVEALYNHYTAYSIQEIIDYIAFLETEKGIINQSTIEHLLQMEPGEYPKLKDVLNDKDADIMDKLLSGKFTIEQAFNKLKQKRAKQTKAEKELEKAKGMYDNQDNNASTLAIDNIGDVSQGEALSDQEIADLGVTPNMLDVENKEVDELLKEGDNIKGFEDKVQKPGERECIDPAMRKAVMARDKNTCQCCLEGGESYVDVNDFHHILPVFLGGADNVDNAECLCVKCHKLVHLHARGQLHLPELDTLTEEDKTKFKRIIARGNYIRKGMETKGVKLDQYKKQDDINKIGRQMPGTKNTIS